MVQQVTPTTFASTAFWLAISDPCLQVVDYAVWAIQRKYEMGDEHFCARIKDKLGSEFQPFLGGRKTYY